MRTKSYAALLGRMVVALGALLMAEQAHAGLTINPVFPTQYRGHAGWGPVVTLQGDPQAQAAVYAAINQIEPQFSNNVTTNFLFYGVHGGSDFLAANISGLGLYTYRQWTTALAADAARNPGNIPLNTAVAHLESGNGFNDPNAFVLPTTVAARALGLGVGVDAVDSSPEYGPRGRFVGGGGFADGIVLINLDAPFFWTRPIPGVASGYGFDAQRAIEHEIDELLGIGGDGSMLNIIHWNPNYARDISATAEVYGPLDLYRYQAPGTPSFDPTTVSLTGCDPSGGCSGLPSPYFSVDGGATSIVEFNQLFPIPGGLGDAGDWGEGMSFCPGDTGFGGTGDVQDAFSCNNQAADVTRGTPSYQALEAIGYNPVPEPSTWMIMLVGLAGIGAAVRRTRRLATA